MTDVKELKERGITLAKAGTELWPQRLTLVTGYGMSVEVEWHQGESVADIAKKFADGLNALPWPLQAPPQFEADGSTVKPVATKSASKGHKRSKP